MSANSSRPTTSIANTSARIVGYRPPPTGPYIPHGLDVLPLPPYCNCRGELNGLRSERRRAAETLRQLRQYNAAAARTAGELAQRRSDHRVPVGWIDTIMHNFDEEEEEEGQDEDSEVEVTQGDFETAEMEIEEDRSDQESISNSDEHGNGDNGGDIQYLVMENTSDRYATTASPLNHAQGLPVIVNATVNTLQQPVPPHVHVPTTGATHINYQLPILSSSQRPNINEQRPPYTTLRIGQARLRGGRAVPPYLQDDAAEVTRLSVSFAVDSRLRMERTFYERLDGMWQREAAGIRATLLEMRESRALASRILSGESNPTERNVWISMVSLLDRSIQLQEIFEAGLMLRDSLSRLVR
ncbi:MAG: hypothetical protein Q9168_000143 [Polycauliona sp. 1 TL-2023]